MMVGCASLGLGDSQGDDSGVTIHHRQAQTMQIPPDMVPPKGQCRIWYKNVPKDKQPPIVSCNQAHADAENFGGAVVWADQHTAAGSGDVAFLDYGNNPFVGVPASRIPPPGQCALWMSELPESLQPAPADCQLVRLDQKQRQTGKVLYMPGR